MTYTPSFDRAVQTRYHALTDRRMAAVVLALRLYAAEHEGKLPETIDTLVPNYLPAIPLDPMAAGLPLKFVPGPAPIVYSVGEDGVDDGGSEQSKSIRVDPHKWDRLDAVVHFKRQPRPAPEELDDRAGAAVTATRRPPRQSAAAKKFLLIMVVVTTIVACDGWQASTRARQANAVRLSGRGSIPQPHSNGGRAGSRRGRDVQDA